MFLAIKNLYLIHIFVKKTSIFWENCYNILHISLQFHSKIYRLHMS